MDNPNPNTQATQQPTNTQQSPEGFRVEPAQQINRNMVNADGTQRVEGSGKVDSVSSSASLGIELGRLGEVLGTTFDTPEKALKSIEHLNSLVGDQTIASQRKNAEYFSKIESVLAPEATTNGFSSTTEYIDYLLSQANTGANGTAANVDPEQWRLQREEEAKTQNRDTALTSVQEELAQMRFEKKFGENALQYYEAHKAWVAAQGYKDIERAWEKSPFKELVETDRKKNATSVIETNSRVANTGGEYEKAFAEAQRSGDWSAVLALKGIGLPK